MRSKTILWIIVGLVLISQSLALGVAPGHVDITFEPNAEHSVKLKITNNDGKALSVVLYAQDELAEYIEFEDEMIEFSKGETEIYIYYIVRLPDNFEKQGLHQADIVVRSIAADKDNSGLGVSASIAIISKLNVMVPYSGKYAEITLFSPHFEVGKGSNFAVEVRSLGTQDILEAQVVIDIFGPLNNKLDTVYSEIIPIASKDKKILTADWTPTLGAGNYYAVATLIYDEKNVKDVRDFTVGTLTINIVDISVTEFTLGGIAKFDILLSSNWNTPISGMFAQTTIKDKSGKVYNEFRTSNVDIEAFGKQRLEAYWDTATVGPGEYKIDVILNYLDKTSQRLFDIFVSIDEIKTTPVGKLITETPGESNLTMLVYILAFLVVLLIIFNVFVYFRKIKKK